MTNSGAATEAKQQEPPKAPIWKRLWEKSGLNVAFLMLMFKGALAPVVALALFQQDGFAQTFTTIGACVAANE